MKKKYPIYFHEDILTQGKVAISAGMRGAQIVASPQDILKITQGKTGPISSAQ